MASSPVDAGGLGYDQVNAQVLRRLATLRMVAPGEIVDGISLWVYRLAAVAYEAGFSDGLAEPRLATNPCAEIPTPPLGPGEHRRG